MQEQGRRTDFMNGLVFGMGLAATALLVHVAPVANPCATPRVERAGSRVRHHWGSGFGGHPHFPALCPVRHVDAPLDPGGAHIGSLGIVYLILFSALESDSPTLTMLQLVRQHRRSGITEHELASWSAKRAYSNVRLQQMLRDGLAEQAGSRIRATRRGKRLTLIVLVYCRMLGLGRGVSAITRLLTGRP